jgi:nicotinic acid mononucleotide adenylyltransferase
MAENLIAEFKFIILSRRGYDVDKLIKEKYSKYKENFTVINIDLPISSTEFRNYKDKEILIEEVYKYIVENKLYEVKDNA